MARSRSENAERISDLLEKGMETSIPITDELEHEHNIIIPDHFKDPTQNPGLSITYEQLIVHRLLMKAASGQDKAIQEVLDRLIGKSPQFVQQVTVQTDYISFIKQCQDADRSLFEEPTADGLDAEIREQHVRRITSTSTEVNRDQVAEEDEFLEDLGQL